MTRQKVSPQNSRFVSRFWLFCWARRLWGVLNYKASVSEYKFVSWSFSLGSILPLVKLWAMSNICNRNGWCVGSFWNALPKLGVVDNGEGGISYPIDWRKTNNNNNVWWTLLSVFRTQTERQCPTIENPQKALLQRPWASGQRRSIRGKREHN